MRRLISTIFVTFLCCLFSEKAVSQCTRTNAAGCFCPTTGATDCYLVCDITAGKKSLNATTGWTEYTQATAGVNKGLIRIDVSTPNIGWGPLEVTPTNDYVCGTDTLRNFFPPNNYFCPDGSYPKRLIKQRVYHKVGNTFANELRDAGWMQFHPAHGHIHIEGWGLYTLRLRDISQIDTLKWPIVNSGVKVSFCLIDLTTCSGSLGDCVDANGNVLNNASFLNYGLGGGYSCGQALQGISVGKVDIYHQSLDESFIRIPYESCNGQYHVVVQIDPDNHFMEMNENNNWLAAPVVLSKQRTTNTNPYSYIFSKNGNIMCAGDVLELEANGANSYIWSTGATTQKINVSTPGKYWVRSTTPCGVATSDTLNVVAPPASSIPSVTKADTVCTGQRANLYASGNAHWFDALTGGNLVFIGNNFQTGNLSSNTTFYVADQPTVLTGRAGPATTNFSAAGNYTTSRNEYLIFNAFMPFKLKKITVDASVAGTRIFQLRTVYGDLIAQKSVALTAGVQDVTLDLFIPAGLNMQLGLSSSSPTTSLYTSTAPSGNIGYPYRMTSVALIVGSSLGDNFFPFSYNWDIEVTPKVCNTGTRKAVTATVIAMAPAAINGLQSLYHHTDNAVPFTLTPTGGTLTGNGIIGNYFYPRFAGIGTHQVTYRFQIGNCINEVTKDITVDYNDAVMQDGLFIQLFNNPGTQQRLYVVTRTASALEVRLLASNGQLIRKMNFVASAGSNLFPIDVSYLSKGIYVLEVLHVASGVKKNIKMLN